MLIDQLCSWQFSFRTVPGKHLFNQKLGNIRNVIAFFGKSEWSHAVRILFFSNFETNICPSEMLPHAECGCGTNRLSSGMGIVDYMLLYTCETDSG